MATVSKANGHVHRPRQAVRRKRMSSYAEAFASRQIEISAVPLALLLAANLYAGPPRYELRSLLL